jgi:hypothetical protein
MAGGAAGGRSLGQIESQVDCGVTVRVVLALDTQACPSSRGPAPILILLLRTLYGSVTDLYSESL